jgi:hypothetical protein
VANTDTRVQDAKTKRKPITLRAQRIQKKGNIKHLSIAHFASLKDTLWKNVEKRKIGIKTIRK